MKSSLLKNFTNRSMGFKLITIFLSVILIPMTLLAYISYRVIDARLMKEAREKISMGLKAAWTEYYVRGEQMRYGMLQAAAQEEIRAAVARRDKVYLKKTMTSWKQMRPYVDVWAVTDAEGRVIARLNSDSSGDALELSAVIANAVETGEPRMATEILGKNFLRFEGSLNVEKERTVEKGRGEAAGEGLMALVVVTPVLNDSRRAIGVIVTGDVINKDDHVPNTVSYKTPGLFTTISMNGARMASNIIDHDGHSVIGTKIPEGAVSGLGSGKPVFAEWELPGMTFVSVFEPIRDFQGKVIGSIDVGASKEKLWDIQQENQRVIALITLIGLTISLMAALVSTYEITRPLKMLKGKLGDFAAGDLKARVEVDGMVQTKDELKMLGMAFNSMMDEVSRRETEKERHLKEIGEKNSELYRLNDELRVTNESLEVAYEETQSQTEELHAINEELKLLNEDLDRKNSELQRANRIIKEEEEQVKSAKDKLRFIYDSITDYILLVDFDGRIIEANRHFLEKYDLSESAAAGERLYGFFGMDAPKNCPIKRSIAMADTVEVEMTAPDGEIYTWHCYPSANEHEDPRMAVVYIKDVTEQRFLMNKLMQADKLSSLGELVSGVAHELNNPLTGIMCFSELLMDSSPEEDVRSKLGKINDASHRCKKIIDNLLTFARWKRPEKKYADINKVVRESVDLRAYQLKVDNIEVALDLAQVPHTMLDEDQIHQVFLNLINNARDAIKEKGERGRIGISSTHSEGVITVRFEDTGKGISEEVVNRIFDPFFTTKGVGKGTGLGLSISYGIIHEHGGNIYATSVPGSGTTFVVELPVVENTSEEAIEKRPGVSLKLLREKAEGKRVLILDDEEIVLELLFEALTFSGFKVDKTGSAEEALQKIRENDYDFIISDIKMPGLDGKGFYRGVSEVRPEARGRIIFISGDSLNNDTEKFLKETGNLSLKKPFTVDELNEVISRFLF